MGNTNKIGEKQGKILYRPGLKSLAFCNFALVSFVPAHPEMAQREIRPSLL